jgi:hypothetical protein
MHALLDPLEVIVSMCGTICRGDAAIVKATFTSDGAHTGHHLIIHGRIAETHDCCWEK